MQRLNAALGQGGVGLTVQVVCTALMAVQTLLFNVEPSVHVIATQRTSGPPDQLLHASMGGDEVWQSAVLHQRQGWIALVVVNDLSA